MTRDEALQLLHEKLKNQNLIKHMLAVEAIMRVLARYFKEDEEAWGLAGLLHDADYEEAKDEPSKQGVIIAEELRWKGVNEKICQAIKAHNPETGTLRRSKMDKTIYAADPLTGLIVATVLVLPEKKLAKVGVENVLNRFKEKSFARGARREAIASCEEFDMSLEEFIKVGLGAMQEISDNLGL